jgi:hypothetical protein
MRGFVDSSYYVPPPAPGPIELDLLNCTDFAELTSQEFINFPMDKAITG